MAVRCKRCGTRGRNEIRDGIMGVGCPNVRCGNWSEYFTKSKWKADKADNDENDGQGCDVMDVMEDLEEEEDL